jgi:glyoxylase-like metal-dependent hydrolase (beta-lactamase superfamily II)
MITALSSNDVIEPKVDMTTRTGRRPPEVAEGVYRLGTRWINFYLVAEEREFTLIDAGYPGYWRHLCAAIDGLDASLEAIRAVIVTHHHADHAGTAEQLRSTAGARVFAGEADAWIVAGNYPSHASPGFYRQSSCRPSGIRFLAHSAAAGGANYRPVAKVETLKADQSLDLPGRPRVVHTPGHTGGHYSVALDERGVLLAGDALATFDYVTGARRMGLHRLNDDREIALASLDHLDAVDAEIVLPAHGDPWTGGLRRALELARENPGKEPGHDG